MKITIRKDHILLGDNYYNIEDLFTSDFYEISDLQAGNFYSSSILVNELFLYIIQPYLALNFFISKNKISLIDASQANQLLGLYLIDIAKKQNIVIIKNERTKFEPIFSKLTGFLYILLTFFYLCYLMIKIKYIPSNISWGEFSITRDKASISRLEPFDIHKEVEDPWSQDSVYRNFTKYKRLIWVSKSLLPAIRELYYSTSFIKKKLGNNSSALVPKRYGRRLLHTFLYYNLFDELFKNNKFGTYYSGINLERFSVIEDQLAEKYNLKTICIPHGLEYGYKFPKGFSSELFYSTSFNAARHLNDLYETNKFIFDQRVAEKMFNNGTSSTKKEKKIVFFTEPREPYVNLKIIRELLPQLKKANIDLYIKHHPGDRIDDYVEFIGKVKVIKSLDEALSNNICFARKSTTLIEALYNNSQVAAILINEKDKSIFSTFPSLQDDKISVFFDINNLCYWIESNFKKKRINST